MEIIKTDVAIIGGGASGLMTAVAIAKANIACKVLVIEHHQRTGKKLMATGNGRCNLTNTDIFDNAYYGSAKFYANKLFKKYTCEYITNYFSEIGLITRADSEGRVYPVSNNVASVLDSIRNYILAHNIKEICNTTVTNIVKCKNTYTLECENTKIIAKYVVLACGGMASSKLSTNGFGYRLAKGLNISFSKPLPSLVTVPCDNKCLTALKGLRIKGTVSLIADGKAINTENGEIQFSNGALSGICVFQLSRMVNEFFEYSSINGIKYNKINLVIDIMPEYTKEECKGLLYSRLAVMGKYPMENFFDGFLHKRVASAIMQKCNIKTDKRNCATLTKKEISSIAECLKYWCFTPSEKSDFENAQVTAGGVIAEELDFNSMQSKKHKGLYIIGELVDIDGICGGYNLHWAWTSGIIAGENIIKNFRGKNDKVK